MRQIDSYTAPKNYEACFKNRQGHCKDVYVTVATIPQSSKSVASFLDITERKRAEENLRPSHKELEQRSYEISQLNEMLDLLQVCHAREETYRIIGHFVQKLFQSDSGFLGIFKDSRSVLDVALVWGGYELNEQSIRHDECWGLRQGKVHAASAEPGGGVLCDHVHPVESMNYLCVPLVAQGEVLGLFHLCCLWPEGSKSCELMQRTIDAKQRLAAAVTDHVALALANHREFNRAERHNHSLAIIMLDLDHFKRFNDTYGHDAGDFLLTEIGAILKNMVRGEDAACRYGGEEFIVILASTTMEIALKRAEEIRQKVKNLKVQYQNKDLGSVSVSLGVALYDKQAMMTSAAVLKAADNALYQAKNQGRDQVVA